MLNRLLARPVRGGQLRAVAEGHASRLEIDPVGDPDEALGLLEMLRRSPDGMVSRRLRNAVTEQSRHRIVDELVARQSSTRELAAQLCGWLEIEAAVPWLEMRLLDRNRRVRLASARALGRLGGALAAEALLRATGRARIPESRLIVELAKAAPHLFLEQVIADPDWELQRPTAIAALGLRGPVRLSPAILLQHVPARGSVELVPLCHVIAKLGDRTAVPWLFGLLDHESASVRTAADHALQRIHRTAFGRPLTQPLRLVGAG
jgi:HEAT repeat protein